MASLAIAPGTTAVLIALLLVPLALVAAGRVSLEDPYGYFKLAGVFMAIASVAGVMQKIGAMKYHAVRVLIYGIVALIGLLGLYNVLATQFRLWEPVTVEDLLRRLLGR